MLGLLAEKRVELYMGESFSSPGISLKYGKIESLAPDDLDRYAERMRCGMFDTSPDDNIPPDYIVIPLKFQNFTHAAVGPVSFAVDVGNSYARIIDVQYSVLAPEGKAIPVRNDLRQIKWRTATNSIPAWVTFDWKQLRVAANVYVSISSNRGFGKINPQPITNDAAPLFMAPTPKPNFYFTYVRSDTGTAESDYSEILDVPNPLYWTPQPSESLRNKTPALVGGAQVDFPQSSTTITFAEGLDSDGTVAVYLLGKVPPGQTITPSVKMNGKPGVLFKQANSGPRYYVRSTEVLNPAKLSITPFEVHAESAGNKVVFFWDFETCSNYCGMKIFRSRMRLIGDYADVGSEIFDGFGSTNAFHFLCLNTLNCPYQPAFEIGTDYQKFYDSAPVVRARLKPKGSLLPAPTNFQIFQSEVGFASFIDTPPEQNVAFTYTFYAYDRAGTLSYPIVVNASIYSQASNFVYVPEP